MNLVVPLNYDAMVNGSICILITRSLIMFAIGKTLLLYWEVRLTKELVMLIQLTPLLKFVFQFINLPAILISYIFGTPNILRIVLGWTK